MGIDSIQRGIDAVRLECGGLVSVAVRNVENAIDLSVDDDVVLSSASIIKVPIIVEAMRRVAAGNLSLDMEFGVRDEDRVRGSGVIRYLHSGAMLTLKDMLTLMMIVSDNTATNVLIDLLGPDSVNRTLRAMGFPRTALQRKMYDWDAIEEGLDNLCCASEIADLLVRIARREAAGGEWDEMILDILHHQQETSRLGMFLPDEARLANKTGSREGIFHDCGIVTRGSIRYTIAVFTQGANSPGEAQLAIARVSRVVYDSIARGH